MLLLLQGRKSTLLHFLWLSIFPTCDSEMYHMLLSLLGLKFTMNYEAL